MVGILKDFGENIGMAFQIKDDLFDYQKQGIIGKPTGNDIKEKKFTLPLIHALENCSSSERHYIIRTIKKEDVLFFTKDGLIYLFPAVFLYP